MPHDLMTKCEKKKLFLRDGLKYEEWAPEKVSNLMSGAARGQIRCMHCHGAVRVHKQKVPHGPVDHVEHLSRQDSERCKGGIYFNGNHQMSSSPVE